MPLDDKDKKSDLPLLRTGIVATPGAAEARTWGPKPDRGDWRFLPTPDKYMGRTLVNVDTGEVRGGLDIESKATGMYPYWYKESAKYGDIALDVAILVDVGYSLTKLGIHLYRNAPAMFKASKGFIKDAKLAHKIKKMSVQDIFDAIGGHKGGDPEVAKWFAGLNDEAKKRFIVGLKTDVKAAAKAAKETVKKPEVAPVQKFLGQKPTTEHMVHEKLNELKRMTKVSVDDFTPDMLEKQISLTDDVLELAERLPVSQQKKVIAIIDELSELHGPWLVSRHHALSEYAAKVDWSGEAAKVNVKFEGHQELVDGKTMPLFTDNITGTTFTVEPGESLLDALNRKRRQFKAPLFNTDGAIDLSKFKLKKRPAIDPQTPESARAVEAFDKNDAQITAHVKKTMAAKLRSFRRFFTVPTSYTEKTLMNLSKGVEFTDVENTEALQVLADMIFARQGPRALASRETLALGKKIRGGLSNAKYQAYNRYRTAQRIDAIATNDAKRKAVLERRLMEVNERTKSLKALLSGSPAHVKRVLNKMGLKAQELPAEVKTQAVKELAGLKKIRKDTKAGLAFERQHIMTPDDARAYINDIRADAELMREFEPRDKILAEFYNGKLKQLFNEGVQTAEDVKNMQAVGFYNPQYWLDKIDPDAPLKRQIPRSLSVSRSGRLKPLSSGDIEALEIDTMAQISAYTSMTDSVIMRNRAAQSARKLALTGDNSVFQQPPIIDSKTKEPITGVRTLAEAQELAEGPVTWADAPEGWNVVFSLEDGIETPLWIREEFAVEWITQDPMINHAALRIFQWLGLSKPVKFMATGPGNPLWGLTGNLMMDLATSFITQYQYGLGVDAISHLAKANRNMALVAPDVLMNKGIVSDRYEAGAGISMLFEEWQYPKLLGDQFSIPSRASEEFEAWANIVTYLNSTSEEAMRAADTLQAARALVANKGVKVSQTASWEELKKHMTPEEARRIHYSALARGNFPHAGAFWQYLDTIAPYTRASYAVTRNQYIMGKKHPKAFMWRIANIMAVTGALYGARRLMPEKYAQFDPQAELNNWLVPIPGMEYKDKEGMVRQQALKIKKEVAVRPVSAFTTALLDYALDGKEPDRKQLWKAAQEILPYAPETSTFPAFSLLYGWATGRDLQTGRKIWTGREVEDPTLEAQPGMHPIWTNLGQKLNTSPMKLRHSFQQVFTYGSPIVQSLALPLSLAFESMPYEYREQGWGKVSKIPGGKKLFASSRPSSEFYQIIEESDKISSNIYEIIDQPLEASLAAWTRGEIKFSEVLALANELVKDQPTHVERVNNKVKEWQRYEQTLRLFEQRAEVRPIPRATLFSLKNANPEARAIGIYEIMGRPRRSSMEQAVYWEALNIMGRNEKVSKDKKGRGYVRVTNSYFTDNCVYFMGLRYEQYKDKIDLSVIPKALHERIRQINELAKAAGRI